MDIQCQPGSSAAGKECLGTDARDTMSGTEGNVEIRGLGNGDAARGLGGVDALEGDNLEVSLSARATTRSSAEPVATRSRTAR